MTPTWITYRIFDIDGVIVGFRTFGGNSRQRRAAIRATVRQLGAVEVRRSTYAKGDAATNATEVRLNCSTIKEQA